MTSLDLPFQTNSTSCLSANSKERYLSGKGLSGRFEIADNLLLFPVSQSWHKSPLLCCLARIKYSNSRGNAQQPAQYKTVAKGVRSRFAVQIVPDCLPFVRERRMLYMAVMTERSD